MKAASMKLASIEAASINVALIGDVHGNLPALEAVLRDAHAAGAATIWNLGDFVGYGPFPDEVVCRLRRQRAASILGNYDKKVLAFRRKRKKWQVTKAPKKYLAFEFAYRKLSQGSRRYLQSLPRELRIGLGPHRVLLTHGSPAAVDEALGPETPDDRLAYLAGIADANLVACGHSHCPFVRQVDGVQFVNPGSVGRPEGGDPRACYTLLDLAAAEPAIRPRRIEYDVDRTIGAIRAADLPEEFVRMLREGKNLNQVQSSQVPVPPALDDGHCQIAR